MLQELALSSFYQMTAITTAARLIEPILPWMMRTAYFFAFGLMATTCLGKKSRVLELIPAKMLIYQYSNGAGKQTNDQGNMQGFEQQAKKAVFFRKERFE